MCRGRHLTRLTNNEVNTKINTAELKDECKTYIEQLFYDTRPEPPEIGDDTEPYILVNEVTKARKLMKEGKSPGPDNVTIEFLKLLDEDNVRWVTSVINRVYTSAKIPHENVNNIEQ
ncbi:hypothetical protein Trydic_g3456 [Trypoxylus dichotomus]